MLRFCLRTLLLIMMLSTALFTARLIGRAQPAPSLFAVIFTNPDGSPCQVPCMFGVKPGKMTAAQTVNVLTQHPAVRFMRVGQGLQGNTYVESGVGKIYPTRPRFSQPDTFIDGISITFNSTEGSCTDPKALLLGDILTKFGAPDQIQNHISICDSKGCKRGSDLLYRNQHLFVTAARRDDDFVRPYDRLCSLWVGQAGDIDIAGDQWQGFGPVDRLRRD